MKLEVILDTDQLPVHYHFLFVSIIKNAISRISKEKMESLYYFQDKINKQGKNFSFAVYLSDFIMEKDIFHINGYIKWTISSNDYAFLLYLYDGLITQEKFTYQNATLRVKSIRTIESQKIKSRKCIFQTLSPITVKGKNGRFLSIEDPDFTKEYIYICRKIIFNNADRNPLEPLFFKPLNMKSVMVQVKHKDFDKLNKDSILFVKAYKGLFELQGHPEDLNILSQTGASFRKSQGFGCIKLISQS